MSRPIEAITFDVGGTLIDPWPSVGAVYASVAAEFGIECSAQRLNAQFANAWTSRSGFGYSHAEWCAVVRQSFDGLADVSEDLFEAIYTRFAEADAWLIYDDVIPTLRELEKLGVPMAVVSNWDDRLIPLLERLGLASYFNHIVVSSLAGAHKPNPAIFHHAAELLCVPPDHLLHIGDSQREDVRGAEEIGARALRIRRSGTEAKHDIPSLTALPRLLAKTISALDINQIC